MAQATVNVRLDEADKQQFEQLCSELGMSMSTAFNVCAKAMLRYQGFPFEIHTEHPNAETQQAIDDVNNGQNLIGPFETVEELRAYLDA